MGFILIYYNVFYFDNSSDVYVFLHNNNYILIFSFCELCMISIRK